LTTVYFDKSAFSELWRSKSFAHRDLLRIRRRLCSSWFERRPRVVVGPKLISELAPLRGKEQFWSEIELLKTLPDPLYLTDVPERVALEIAAHATGASADVFLPRERLLRALNGPVPMWNAELIRLGTDRSYLATKDSAARDALVAWARGSQGLLHAEAQRWFADPVAKVQEHGRTLLRDVWQQRLRLTDAWIACCEPSRLPTIWGIAAYRTSQIFLATRDGRRVDKNDATDWLHYAGAMYADEFVVQDGRFRAIVDAAPRPKPKAMTFEDWAAQVLK
jgi:hypothetical protein